jgi:hypothetical protein
MDAINNESQLRINFPELHYDQLLLAKNSSNRKVELVLPTALVPWMGCLSILDFKTPTLLQVEKTG